MSKKPPVRSSRARVALLASLLCGLSACVSESHRTLDTPSMPSQAVPYLGPRVPLSVGKFDNTSPYMRGIFSDGVDRLGNQAKTILVTHLSQTGRFDVVDRQNLEEIAFEADVAGTSQELVGADVVVTGQVTEFGRKTTGDTQLFGIGGRGTTQTAYSKVSLSVVDVRTGRILHSVQGAGEYDLSSREVLGFGSTMGYDSTLNGKVLDLAITDAVEKLVVSMERGEWRAGSEG